MTTIAYRNGVMAADSLVTSGDIRRGETSKLFRLADGGIAGIAGSLGATRMLVDWLNAGAIWTDRPSLPDGVDAYAIVVRPDASVAVLSKDWLLQPIRAPFEALGSGNEIALGAMAMGASAAQAVEIAAQFDVFTGGEVVVLSLTPASPRTEDGR